MGRLLTIKPINSDEQKISVLSIDDVIEVISKNLGDDIANYVQEEIDIKSKAYVEYLTDSYGTVELNQLYSNLIYKTLNELDETIMIINDAYEKLNDIEIPDYRLSETALYDLKKKIKSIMTNLELNT